MASLTNIMLEGNQKFSGKNYNTWKQRMLTIFEYRCLASIVLGKETRPIVVGRDQGKFDRQNKEAVMLLKLSVIDEMLPEVQTGTNSATIWQHLKEMHETLDKARAFFLNNTLFSMMMEEHAYL